MTDLEWKMFRAPLGGTAQSFVHDGDDEHPVESSDERTSATLDASSAEHHGDDDLKFQAGEGAGADGAVARGEGEGGEKAEKAHERVNL